MNLFMRAFTLLLAALLLTGCGSRTQFDQGRWRNADLGTSERAHMVASLSREHALKGMGRTEIVELLGLPALNDKWEGSEMIYLLGPNRGLMAIGHEWLLIELDQQDRVSSYRVVSD